MVQYDLFYNMLVIGVKVKSKNIIEKRIKY